jgi:solute carrier family 25 (adenine nucleotide translocator) protein 4/5/6/31
MCDLVKIVSTRGNVANCVRYVPTAACNLAFKDAIKGIFPKYSKDTDFGKFAACQVASGSLAGAATNTIVYPLVYVRTVLGADLGKVKKYSGMGDCIKKTVSSNGVLSLYNGIAASTAGIVVYRGTQFGLQDTIKAFNPYQKDFSIVGIASKFLVAQIAVSASGIVAYPFDTVQRRMQIEASKPVEEQVYKNVGECISKIYSAEGAGGFFKGALANIVRGTGAAIVLVMYDEILNFIEKQ